MDAPVSLVNSERVVDSPISPLEARSPIFIGGQRRSGTSLFRVLLNRHPHIACGPESKFVQGSFVDWHERLLDQWADFIDTYGLSAHDVDSGIAALVDTLFTRYQLREGKIRWAEKSPGNILAIDYLFRLFPRAQFIHVIRDPRDTYCSIRDRARRDRPDWEKFHPSRAARDWRAAILAGIPWRARPDRYLEVRYEELVREPESSLRRVMTFLNEAWDPRLLDPDADNSEARGDRQVRRGPIITTSIGRWRSELSGTEVKKIERVAGELMAELGYDPALASSHRRPGPVSSPGTV